jgi:hypothetical protein
VPERRTSARAAHKSERPEEPHAGARAGLPRGGKVGSMPNVNLIKYRDLAKGFRHGNKTNKRVMANRVDKALEYAYVSRKLKKRGK